MNAAKPIQATFADFKLIKGRKCAQLVFEVPLEGADAALTALGGLPRPDAERWFGIVALDLSKPASEPEKTRKQWSELPMAQQAAMRCAEPGFWRFIRRKDAVEAAAFIRARCGINSRSELSTNPDAGAKWLALDTEYFRESRGIR
jgi:hypothetical protein